MKQYQQPVPDNARLKGEKINVMQYLTECIELANNQFKKSIKLEQVRYDDFLHYLRVEGFIYLDKVGSDRKLDTAYLMKDFKLDDRNLKHYFLHIVLKEGKNATTN